jgi:hypothetical protein
MTWSVHSPWAPANPRSRRCPAACRTFIWPKAGSTMAFAVVCLFDEHLGGVDTRQSCRRFQGLHYVTARHSRLMVIV